MDVVVDLASPADDAGIRGLVGRQVMPGRIRLALPREPDFSLGCTVTGRDCRIVVARSIDDGAIVGVACRAVRHVFLNGREQRIGYLGQLRVDERVRGRWLVSRGFSLLERIDREDPVPAYLASIVDGNVEATGVLVRKRRQSFPSFREVARYRTLALRVRRVKLMSTDRTMARQSGAEKIERATASDLPAIVSFLRHEGAQRQFFSAWTEETLRELTALGLRIDDIHVARAGGVIVGVLALWDQTAYKQAVVRGYSGWLKVLASLSNVGVPWLTRSLLPGVGDHVRSAYAALLCVASSDATVFARLLRDVYDRAAARGFDYLV